jgi:hypothetical protein
VGTLPCARDALLQWILRFFLPGSGFATDKSLLLCASYEVERELKRSLTAQVKHVHGRREKMDHRVSHFIYFSKFGKFSISCKFFSILAPPHTLFLRFFLPRFFDYFFDSSFLDFLILFPKFFLIWIRSAPSILPPWIPSLLRGNRTSSPMMVVVASLITLSHHTSVCSIYRSNRSVN